MTTTYMTFGLGESLFAFPVTLVQEILDAQPVVSLPDSPDTILGLIDVHDSHVAVMDMRSLLGEPPRTATEAGFAVLQVQVEGHPRRVAVPFDKIVGVAKLDDRETARVGRGSPLVLERPAAGGPATILAFPDRRSTCTRATPGHDVNLPPKRATLHKRTAP